MTPPPASSSRVSAYPAPKMALFLAPIAKPGIVQVNTSLPRVAIAELLVETLTPAKLSDDLCLRTPSIITLHEPFAAPDVVDLTPWLLQHDLQPPRIEQLFAPLKQPGVIGKAYAKEQEKLVQRPLVDGAAEMRCKHGLIKSQCATCRQEREQRQPREKQPRQPDIWEMLKVLLMPPLGENLDNQIAFPRPLFPFQREGVLFLAQRQAALLADDMGLGKTIQAITAARLLFRNGAVKSAVVICPKAVLRNWETEFDDWAPELRVIRVSGNAGDRAMCWKASAHVYLVTYDSWLRDQPEGIAPSFDLCILDEAQRIKNRDTATAQAVHKIHSAYRWGLSGTPLENKLDDVVSLFAFIKPGLLSYDHTPSEVRTRIKQYFLRRRKTDVLTELPEKRREDIWLELTPEQRAAYDRAEREGVGNLSRLGERISRVNILALISTLKQICNLDPESGASCKLDYLIEQLQNITEASEKALVFSQFPDKTLSMIVPRLIEFKPLVYHGELSDAQRQLVLAQFKQLPDHSVLLLSTRAGGVGLNLTEANHVFHFDLWWNPATAAQAEDRAHRIGQTRGVQVESLLAKDTIEERIQQLLMKKGLLFDDVIDSQSEKAISDNLTMEELLRLFNLGAPQLQPVNKQPVTARSEPVGASELAEQVRRLSPQDFEHLIAQLYEAMGYKATLTPHSHDGGVDVYATQLTSTGVRRLAVQCKHYPDGVVGAEIVRDMLGVLQADARLTTGVIVTSGDFSQGAKDLAQRQRVELVNCDMLVGLLIRHGVNVHSNSQS